MKRTNGDKFADALAILGMTFVAIFLILVVFSAYIE
jgi:hypothetical protein